MAGGSTSRAEGPAGGRQVFAAQRARSDAVAAGLFGLLGVALFALTVSRGVTTQRAGFIWGIGMPALLLLGGVALVLARRYFDRRPVLKLSDAGLKARGLARPLRWEEIDDDEYDARNLRLVVHLPRSAEHRKTRQFVSLRRLHRSERDAAFTAVLERVNAKRIALGRGETRTARDLREVAEFDEKLAAMTPRAWAPQAVVALNVGVWLAQVLAGVPAMQPGADVLFDWGGNSASAVLRDGEAWRLLTATFLHAGLVHLALNMVGLWHPGRQLARLLGNGGFLFVYFATALCGSAASLHFAAQSSVSVGASGAVFGVLGALVACGWRHRERLPAMHTRQLWSGPGAFMAYALVQGLASSRVDNAAHVGGLLSGAAIGLLLVPRFQAVAPKQRIAAFATAAVVALAAFVTGVLTTPEPRISHRDSFAALHILREVGPRYDRLGREMQRFARKDASDPAMREFLHGTLLPECAAIDRELAAIRLPPQERPAQAAHMMRRMCSLMTQVARIDLEAVTPDERAQAAERIRALEPQSAALRREMEAFRAAAAKEKAR